MVTMVTMVMVVMVAVAVVYAGARVGLGLLSTATDRLRSVDDCKKPK